MSFSTLIIDQPRNVIQITFIFAARYVLSYKRRLSAGNCHIVTINENLLCMFPMALGAYCPSSLDSKAFSMKHLLLVTQ